MDIDEQLTAYLDGELSAEELRAVEDRLSHDAAFRQRMEEMERAWNLLDRLEPATVDEGFARTTLEMVAVAAAEEVATLDQQQPRRRRRQWLLGALCAAAALAIGYCGARLLLPSPNDALLADLSVIERLDQYQLTPSLEFLRKLSEKPLFAPGAAPTAAAGDTLADRRARVAALSAVDKQRLRGSQERFAELPAARQEQLRDLDRQLALPENRHLADVLARYHEWFERLPLDARDELRSRSLDDRLAEIDRLQRDRPPLERDDFKKIATWFDEYVLARRDEVIASIEEFDPNHADWLRGAAVPQQRLALPFAYGFWLAGRGAEGPPAELLAAFRQFVPQLSPIAQRMFSQADLAEQRQLVFRWLAFAGMKRGEQMRRERGGWLAASPGELARFEQSLSAEDKRVLSNLSGAERERRLKKMYQDTLFPWARREPGGPPFGPRGRDERFPGRDPRRDRDRPGVNTPAT
jgi:hypothetical protein